jgi:hypothetical protein
VFTGVVFYFIVCYVDGDDGVWGNGSFGSLGNFHFFFDDVFSTKYYCAMTN